MRREREREMVGTRHKSETTTRKKWKQKAIKPAFEKYLVTTPKEVEREEAPRGDGLTRISSPNRTTRNLEIKKRSFFFFKKPKNHFSSKIGSIRLIPWP
jgi:hypothetical protein